MAGQNNPQAATLFTNGLSVTLPDDVDVILRDFPDGKLVADERDRLRDHWYVHWFEGKLYHLRLRAGGPNVEGEPISLKTRAHPWLLRARLEDAVSEVFAQYEPFRQRPFSFLALKAELVKDACEIAKIDPQILSGITVTPRYELSAKIYELADGDVRIGIFVTISMRNDIALYLPELKSKNVPLSGLHVVRREPKMGERRHVGRIGSINGAELKLNESADADTIKVGAVKLEGSKENFAQCLDAILGSRKWSFDQALEQSEAKYRLGPDFDERVNEMAYVLSKKPIVLAQGVEAVIGDRIALDNDCETPCIYAAPPVDYIYDRTGARSARTAWDGLVQYGPYDRTSFSTRSPKILVVFPKASQGKVESFLAALRDGMGASSPAYETGFTKIMELVKTDYVMCPVDLAGVPRNAIAQKYRGAMETGLQQDVSPHAAIVVLQNEHATLPGLDNPYIQTKSMLMTLGIASQEVRMSTVTQKAEGLPYTLRNIAVSLYAKMNGTPWTVSQDQKISEELVIGIGFAELSGSRVDARQRHVGITTVFSGDGTYLLGNVSKECAYEDYPQIVRDSMLAVLRDVKKKNNWQSGDTVRIVFHAHRPLKRVDVAKIVFDCAREIGAEQDVQLAFVTVTHDHPFFLIDRTARGVSVKYGSEQKKGVFAPDRGTITRLGRHTRLLATNSGTLIKRPLTPLPQPLLISVHPDSTFSDVDYLSEQVLKFTSLSWRSVLPSRTPVTISYSERIAELLGRLREVPDWSSVALSVKLKYSRWFL
ncbi:Piwi domain-containing protein [Hyphomonas sp.]|uniref:argonaute/piwi family protein n=1 Tax=Hyphomonas sp. TaxID=87 RepID=UPI0025C5007C|nr:Piwi domain-containing protein [Hyphomonas sp.]